MRTRATGAPHVVDPSEGSRRLEQGAVTVLLAGALVLLGVLTLAVVRLGGAAWERSRAQAAADAAALAGVVDGADAAASYARRNGAEVTGWVDAGDEVEVEVRVGAARAVARARRRDPLPPEVGPPESDTAPDTEPDTVPVALAPAPVEGP